MSAPWRRVFPPLIHAVHEQQLAEHGGLAGVRDAGALESALARPQNLAADGEPDAAALAAAYAFGLARNHAFVDGNKRTAWIAARLFLADNGCKLVLDKADAVRTMMALAAGEISEEDFAAWLRERLV
jgi:death-on-curing protein